MENKNKVGKPTGSPKTGGRLKGTANKVTTSLRSKIDSLLQDNWDNVQRDIDSLEAKDRLMFLEKLLGFAVPKLAATTTELEVKGKLDQMSESQLDAMIETILNQSENE
ncbi:hypothetical protein ACVWYG_000726 [Pedobacter sp. UYEF25]